MLLQNYLSNLSAVYWQFWLGLLLVLLVLFARGGLIGGVLGVYRRLMGKRI
jgi:branched-chain amino acid transport system permease protein